MAAYFADHGWDDITLALLVNPRERDAIAALARRVTLGVIVDRPEVVRALAGPLRVWIEVDVGHGRTGVPWDDAAGLRETVAAIAAAPGPRLRGPAHPRRPELRRRRRAPSSRPTRERMQQRAAGHRRRRRDLRGRHARRASPSPTGAASTRCAPATTSSATSCRCRPACARRRAGGLRRGLPGGGDLRGPRGGPRRRGAPGEGTARGRARRLVRRAADARTTTASAALLRDAARDRPLAGTRGDRRPRAWTTSSRPGDVVLVAPVHSCLTCEQFATYRTLDGEVLPRMRRAVNQRLVCRGMAAARRVLVAVLAAGGRLAPRGASRRSGIGEIGAAGRAADLAIGRGIAEDDHGLANRAGPGSRHVSPPSLAKSKRAIRRNAQLSVFFIGWSHKAEKEDR